MIVDKEQFDKFVSILPELENDEVFFVSLSARNKYLDYKERYEFGLGRTEMFSREIARDKEGLYLAMDRLKASLEYRTTKKGLRIPEKALVVYININPSSMVKAYLHFTKECNKDLSQLVPCMMKDDKKTNYEFMKRLPTKLMNSIQKSRSRKYFIDIDCDTSDFKIVSNIKRNLYYHEVDYHIIKTQGGYHILIKKDTLKKELKLHELVALANKDCQEEGGEVVINSNQMIPCPGTIQAGKLVTFL